MTNSFSRRWAIFLLMLMPLIASSACLSLTGSAPAETQTPQASASSPAETKPPEATTTSPTDSPLPDEISVQGNVVFGPGPLNLLTPAAGLSDLSSYKATLRMSFDGTQAGLPSQWSKTYTMLVAREPAARQLTIEKSGQVADPGSVFRAEVAGATYAQRGVEDCTVTPSKPGNALADLMEPAGLLTGVIGAGEAGIETVNDVEAQHYSFDERALGEAGLSHSIGELWVATNGGYIVKYMLATQGNADYFGEGIEGTITWDYELSDINQPSIIEIPEGCPAGMIDAPLLPNAADVLNVPALLSYVTASTLAEADAFYEQQLPLLGWQPASDPVVSETLTMRDFTRGDEQLSVIVLVDKGGTTVQLVLGAIQP